MRGRRFQRREPPRRCSGGRANTHGSSTGFGAPERGKERRISHADGTLMVSLRRRCWGRDVAFSDEVDGRLNGEHTPPVQPFASREIAMAAGTKDRSPSVASHRAGHTLSVAPAASSDSFVLQIRSDACSHRSFCFLACLQHAPRAGQGHVSRRFNCGLSTTGRICARTARARSTTCSRV